MNHLDPIPRFKIEHRRLLRPLIIAIAFCACAAGFESIVEAQFRYQPRYQQQYSPYRGQGYQANPYQQNQYQQNLYQQQLLRQRLLQQRQRQWQVQPNGNQPVNTAPVTRSTGVTPPSVLQYAIKKVEDYNPMPRLSAEFEKQKAVLLSVSDLMYQHNGVLIEILKKSSGRGVPFIVLFNDDKQLKSTVAILDSMNCDLSHVSLLQHKLDSIWLRDFGPRFLETKGGAISMDFYYNGQRPLDDKFPITWGKVAREKTQKVQWTIQGGNMQPNGKGLAIVTSRLFEDNAVNLPGSQANAEFEKRKIVVDAFKEECNINELLILEPLTPEATRHVDMFATFVASNKIVVAKVDAAKDPYNAKILEYNVKLLKQIKVDGEPLEVERIEFPMRNGKFWSPYTNIILANNLLLMPVYKTDPPALVRKAIATYKRLLPNVHVDTVDMTTMQKLEGALHCMSINIPKYAELPSGILTVEQARMLAKKKGYVKKTPKSKLAQNTPIKQPEAVATKWVDTGSSNSNQTIAPKLSPEKVEKKSSKSSLASGSNNSGMSKRNVTSNRNVLKKKPEADSQVSAVMTYRRNFVDSSRSFMIDAYAIGFKGRNVVLLETGKTSEVQIELEKLCNEDKEWIARNASKIRANGSKVKKFVNTNGL